MRIRPFNSLFEMHDKHVCGGSETAVLSILYLRCMGIRGSESVPRMRNYTFNSLFEMQKLDAHYSKIAREITFQFSI